MKFTRRQFVSTTLITAFGVSCGVDTSKTPGGTDVIAFDLSDASTQDDQSPDRDASDVAEDVNPSDMDVDTGSNGLFVAPLFIPAELIGTLKNQRLQYDLDLQEGVSQFLEGKNTTTWGINGSFLGPTLRLKNGTDVDLNFTNNLNEMTTMHGHGMHVPADMDGGPHQVIAVGSTWTASYKVNQIACTNWYHPHLMGKTADHVINGLAGLIIVDDQNSQTLDLPKRYGIDDIPIIVQDRRFLSNGDFDYAPAMREKMMGWKGDTFLVNGVIKPHVDVEAKEIRLRILNGSNARLYDFALKSGRSFKQIATDNSFLESPVTLSEVTLSPAERAEIVIDFTNSLGENDILIDKRTGEELMRINLKRPALETTKTPASLVSLPSFDPSNAVNTRSFVLSGGMGRLFINGQSMNINTINEQVPIDEIEIWEVSNQMPMDHNFHIHATHFQIIERDGSAAKVAENEKGFKDVVYVPPNTSVKFIVKMVDYADANGEYMYHCHILEHEDLGMMGQFVVLP